MKNWGRVIRFAVAAVAYATFFILPPGTVNEPRFILAEGACAAIALVAMGAQGLRSAGHARIIAVVLAIPPLIVLIAVFVGSML